MVSKELDFSRISQFNADNLQNFLERNNQSYSDTRTLYNQLIKNTVNPLLDHGLDTEKDSFIVLLLEKILRNTEYIINQNIANQTELYTTGKEVTNISENGLGPIIAAGNNINIELEKFKEGFQSWNNKFENFSAIFETWNTGFQTLEENLTHLENHITNLNNQHNNLIENLEKILNQIELQLNQWKNELVRINDNSQQTEDNYKNILITLDHLLQSEENYTKTINEKFLTK